jgi:peroxiredoxin
MNSSRRNFAARTLLAAGLCLGGAAGPFLLLPRTLVAQNQRPVLTSQEDAILKQLRGLRALPDDERAKVTKQLAMEIRKLPADGAKVSLANNLASLATEGDFGHETLQEVTTTLAEALREQPDQSAERYAELAKLVRYEHMRVSLENPRMAAAMAGLEAEDRDRQQADFTLADLKGGTWTLKELRGKVVLVNFWATWCPPCRKEMPDLDGLYRRFQSQGLVILAISDEAAAKVTPFLEAHGVAYPILLDPGRKVNELFHVNGIPRSFVYDRTGKLVAQSIDMRTRKQFLEMLEQAGLQE